MPAINAVAPDRLVCGADTVRPDIVPEAAGLLALYRWCRDATGGTHDGTSHQPATSRVTA